MLRADRNRNVGLQEKTHLMAVFDNGERDPAALERAALRGVYVSLGKVMSDV
jgi:hypothetical protein